MANLIAILAGVLCLFMGVVVISAKNPMHAVIALVANFVGLGVLFLLLHAEFLAVIEVIVYAGAVMVLFLFVVALLMAGTRAPQESRGKNLPGQVPLALAATGVFAALVVFALAVRTVLVAPPPSTTDFGSITNFGRALFTTYLLPFELTALVLLAAVIGVVFLARER
ncbi:MAG: NADH-quinone oxidoreductase subunit J family protein [Sulfobacillus sp.]